MGAINAYLKGIRPSLMNSCFNRKTLTKWLSPLNQTNHGTERATCVWPSYFRSFYVIDHALVYVVSVTCANPQEGMASISPTCIYLIKVIIQDSNVIIMSRISYKQMYYFFQRFPRTLEEGKISLIIAQNSPKNCILIFSEIWEKTHTSNKNSCPSYKNSNQNCPLGYPWSRTKEILSFILPWK